MKEQESKAERHKSLRQHRKMTYNAFSIYYSQEQHGGYTTEQLREKWSLICNDDDDVNKGKPFDHKGVVKGQAGHARFKVLLEDADGSISEDETETRRTHEKATKPADEIVLSDIVDFLEGKAELDTPWIRWMCHPS